MNIMNDNTDEKALFPMEEYRITMFNYTIAVLLTILVLGISGYYTKNYRTTIEITAISSIVITFLHPYIGTSVLLLAHKLNIIKVE